MAPTENLFPLDCVMPINTMGQFEDIVAGLDGQPRSITEKKLKDALFSSVCDHVSRNKDFYTALFQNSTLRTTKTFLQEVLAGGNTIGSGSDKISFVSKNEALDFIKGFDIGDPCGTKR